MGLAPL
jgi:hypothetical protein